MHTDLSESSGSTMYYEWIMSFIWLERLPFILVMPNIYTILGANPIAVFMPVALAYLTEIHWRIFIFILFAIRFYPYNVYTLLYGATTYGDIYIFPYPGYWIGAYVRIFIFIWFFVIHLYFISYYICVTFDIFIFYLVFVYWLFIM